MNKGIAIAFVVIGMMLAIFGINAFHSASSSVSRAFTGTPTDRTVWFLVGGIVCVIIGLARLTMNRGTKL